MGDESAHATAPARGHALVSARMDSVNRSPVSLDRRQPITPATNAEVALMAANYATVAPPAFKMFIPLAITKSPKRHTAVSTTFCPL